MIKTQRLKSWSSRSGPEQFNMPIHVITYSAILVYVICIWLIWATAIRMKQQWRIWSLFAIIPTLLITTGVLEIQQAKVDEEHSLLHAIISISTALALTIWVYTLRRFHNDLRDREKNLKAKASYDDLTGLLRRDAWIQATNLEIARAKRSIKPISIVEFDIDDFKCVNDTYGHATGDALLKLIANLSQSLSRPSDILGRIGGEEFFFALPETDLAEATSFANRLRESISQNTFQIGESMVRTTISLGVSVGGQADPEGVQRYPSLPLLMKSADDAMYRAKSAGKNCVR